MARSHRPTQLRRAAFTLWLAIAVGCSVEESGNPYNTALVGRSGQAVVESPGGELIVGRSNIVSEGELLRVEGDKVTSLLSYSATQLRSAAGYVYFAEARPLQIERALGRLSLVDQQLEWLPAKGAAHSIATDDDYLYWFGTVPFGIRRLSHEGGPTDLLLETSHRGGLEVDDSHLYWLTTQGVSRMPKGGGEEESILQPEDWTPYLDSPPISLALSGPYVVMASGAGFAGARGAVLRVGKDGSDVTLLAGDQDGADLVAADAEYVYWVRGYSNDAIEYPGSQDIVRMPLGGGRQQVIARQQNGVTQLLRTRSGLVWTCRNERFLNFAKLE